MARHFLVLAALLLLLTTRMAAQVASPRFAAGGQYSALTLDYPDQTRSGLGGWVSYTLFRRLELDAAVTFTPGDKLPTGRITQLLAGVRTGVTGDHFAVFGRVRPGFTHFTRSFLAPDTFCVLLIFPPPDSCLARQTNFTLDIGGTLEAFPGRPMVIRLDLGDSLLRFNRVGRDPVWTNNLQVAAGAGVRF